MSIAETNVLEAGLPTHLDLPHTDDKPVEGTYQPFQAWLLTSSLTPVLDQLHPDGRYYIGADQGIYWRITQPPERGCRAPDWYYVPNVPRLLDGMLRLSYVLWQEKVSPRIVIEFVYGTGAEEHDDTPNTGKFWIYEQVIQAEYYVIWDHYDLRLEVYELHDGRYRLLPANSNGRVRIPTMKIEFGPLECEWLGNPATWLRAWDHEGNLLPSDEERVRTEECRAESERQRADSEGKRADFEKLRADALAAKLRELGLDPDRI
jgi:Uma2 family endonuclease